MLLCVYAVRYKGTISDLGNERLRGSSGLSIFSVICRSSAAVPPRHLVLPLVLTAAISSSRLPQRESMTLPSISGVDPDPTTQIPWPGARKRSDRELNAPGATTPPLNSRNASWHGSEVSRAEINGKHRRLSTSDLFNLSISMAGAQIAWTIELG